MSATLRPVTAEDGEFLFDLYATTRAEDMAAGGWGPEAVATFLRVQFDAQLRHYERNFPEAEHSIIEEEGKPVGRLYLHDSGEAIRLVDISLLPGSRGAGIGTFILKTLLEKARANRKPVRLSVGKLNPARRLFWRLGFMVTEETDLLIEMEATPPSAD